MRSWIRSTLVVAALAAALPALAQGYPTRPVRIVVGYPPGSGVDLAPRFVGERWAAKLGQPFVVENRPGASGHIATEIVAKAAPDGYTLLSVPAAFATTPHMFASLPFEPDAMVPVVVMISQANVIIVHPERMKNVRTLAELVAVAQANPDKLTYGSAGNGGSHHLSMELLKMLTGVRMIHVPYKGNAAIAGFLAGDVDTGFFTLGGLLPHIKSGRLRPLAVGGGRRHPALPEVPTLGEVLPGMVSAAWFAIIAPPRTPPELVARINAEFVEALRHPDVQKRFADIHADVVANSPAEAAAFIREEKERWGRVIRAASIKAD